MTEYVLSTSSLVVHREDCPLINRPRTDYWNQPWGEESRSEYDRACGRCLPDGIPDLLDAPRPGRTAQERAAARRRVEQDRLTLDEAKAMLNEMAHLLQRARPDGHDRGNNASWGRARKRLVSRLIDLGVWE